MASADAEVAISRRVDCEIATSGRSQWKVATIGCPEWKIATTRCASGSGLGRPEESATQASSAAAGDEGYTTPISREVTSFSAAEATTDEV